jgi:SNF2-related domain
MISAELYSQNRPTVVVEQSKSVNPGAWARLQEAFSRGVLSGSSDQTVVHADVFFSELDVLRELRTVFGERVDIGPALKSHLDSMVRDRRQREASLTGEPHSIDLDALAAELTASGFKRMLMPFQLSNLVRLLRLPHAADFSVPGAGKTTVALAAYSIRRKRGLVDRLAVIAPIAAFEAWREDTQACFDAPPKFAIYSGSGAFIPGGTEVLVCNYNRAANNYDDIRQFVASAKTQVVLDEAHRVKRGAAGVHGRAVLDLAYAATRRDVLTGTPAPQGAYDLVALMKFLYPGQDRQILPRSTYLAEQGREAEVLQETHEAVARYFVRTPKSALQLPPTTFNVVRRSMSPIQSAIYDSLIGQYKASFALGDRGRHEMQRLGRVVIYLLEAATNPMLLTAGSDDGDDPGFSHPPLELQGNESLKELLARYNNFETPWKYNEVASIVARAAFRGEKVLIWTNFVRNIRMLMRLLAAHQPAAVYGAIPSESAAAQGTLTREMEFTRFRQDSACHVLIANPAACGEGVSLHHWCHHAVYLDRSFNAGHFLQSQDRIHRLGLAKGTVTNFTILASQGTIDDSVHGRLTEKVHALSRLMNDPGLVQIALPAPDEGEGGAAAFQDDAAAIVAHVESSNARVA